MRAPSPLPMSYPAILTMFGFQSFGAATYSSGGRITVSDSTMQPTRSSASSPRRSAFTRARISARDATPLATRNVSQAIPSGISVQYEKKPNPPIRSVPRILKMYGVPGSCAARVGRGCQKFTSPSATSTLARVASQLGSVTAKIACMLSRERSRLVWSRRTPKRDLRFERGPDDDGSP